MIILHCFLLYPGFVGPPSADSSPSVSFSPPLNTRSNFSFKASTLSCTKKTEKDKQTGILKKNLQKVSGWKIVENFILKSKQFSFTYDFTGDRKSPRNSKMSRKRGSPQSVRGRFRGGGGLGS